MKITTFEVAGLESAMYGMRLPMNSHDKADSDICEVAMGCMVEKCCDSCFNRAKENYCLMTKKGEFVIGKNDMSLAQRLLKAGSEHSKYARQIQVWALVDMPRYWWSEADTYKFNTKNSESTMHRLLNNVKPITMDMFETCDEDIEYWEMVVGKLEFLRVEFRNSTDQQYKNRLLVRAKRLLPEGILQARMMNTNYAELRNMYHQRKNHRLKEEWKDVFCSWVESLPYAKELIIGE